MSKDTIYIQDAIDAFYLQADDDGWWCGTAEDMETLLKGLPPAQPVDKDINVPINDTISRQDAIDALKERRALYCDNTPASFSELSFANKSRVDELDAAIATLVNLSPVQSERDIPMKPNETIDSSWGIRKKQAVCPKCDYYLNRIYFFGDSKNKKVTYCETCGQAIDWEGWE